MSPTGLTSTLAGSGSYGFADGAGAAASFNGPTGVAVIPSSGVIVVADTSNFRIRLISPTGLTSTLAGSGSGAFADGTGAAASFSYPRGVAVIPSSGVIVVADQGNHRIRLVSPTGLTSTLAGSGSAGFADGTGAAASFNNPSGVAVIPSSGVIVVADQGNYRIRLIRRMRLLEVSATTMTPLEGMTTTPRGKLKLAAAPAPSAKAALPLPASVVVGPPGVLPWTTSALPAPPTRPQPRTTAAVVDAGHRTHALAHHGTSPSLGIPGGALEPGAVR